MDGGNFKYKPLDQQRRLQQRRSPRLLLMIVATLGLLLVLLFAHLLVRFDNGFRSVIITFNSPNTKIDYEQTPEIVHLNLNKIPVNQPSQAKTPVKKHDDNVDLITQLKSLIFLNSGETKKTDKFVWQQKQCLYLESQNVSRPYKAWADQGPFNYLYQQVGSVIDHPPSGIRSSVPLGGISTGVFELRGDGSFHEFTIFNQHPAGAAKIQLLDDMFMAVRTKDDKNKIVARVLQTHPSNGNLTGVYALKYKGSYPVSFLSVDEPDLPVDVSVYAYSRYKSNDMNSSATPAVAFTAVIKNSGDVPLQTAFSLNLPIGIERHTRRVFMQLPPNITSADSLNLSEDPTEEEVRSFLYRNNTTKTIKLTRDYEDQDLAVKCMKSCSDSDFVTWSYEIEKDLCHLSPIPLLNGQDDGFVSGIKSEWSKDGECLTVNRDTPGYSTNGNMSLCAFSSDQDVKIEMATGNEISSLWEAFSTDKQTGVTEGLFASGMVSGQVNLHRGETKEITIVLSWYFPERDFLGMQIGNYYSHLFDNSSHAARGLGNDLSNTVSDIASIHIPFLESSVDPTLTDMLINSLSHIRSAFWLKDGRWRQWEAHDCVNVDSVHNDGERHMPYMMMFPDSVINKMRAWAKYQLSDGMIQEQLRCGCLTLPINNFEDVDYGCGRVMSDVSSMFIVYLLELLHWHPDQNMTQEVVKELWPNAKRAAQWHLSRSGEHGIPTFLFTTYDPLYLETYPFATYVGAFHLLAMRAATELALWMNDTEFAATCDEAFLRGREALDDLLWNSTGLYYNAYSVTKPDDFDEAYYFSDLQFNLCDYPQYHQEEWGECHQGFPTTPGAIMTDSFYAQVLAYSLGLGTLVKDENKLRLHMKAERAHNHSPNGMYVMTGRYTEEPIPFNDNAIWMMGNTNWGSIQIHLGEDPNEALEYALVTFNQWRLKLHDMWNVAGILGTVNDSSYGVPYITSHYGYYMSSWHLIPALSGQYANMQNQTLKFSPKVSCKERPYKLPVILPTVWGTLECDPSPSNDTLSAQFTLTLVYGELKLKSLSVETVEMENSCPYEEQGKSTITIKSGEPKRWLCQL